ncbi:MAG TPA: hypothetical protein VFK22_02185 [Candidatus Dormibacteraeota bacterium]|nr:hypothetical protein [Candidatus Dormibacteraeota bacterium]
MVAAVEFDNQSRTFVIEIGTSDERALRVMQCTLNARSGHACFQEQPAQSRLHRRLGRFRKGVEATETCSESCVGQDESFNPWRAAADIAKRLRYTCRTKPANRRHIQLRDEAAPHSDVVPRPQP